MAAQWNILNNMEFIQGPIAGLVLIRHKRWEDNRGSFMEQYNQDLFYENGITANFVQDNVSISHKDVLRGLHAQSSPHAQGKLVRVLQGKAWDVVVDIRKDSPTYGQYTSLELNADEPLSFWIPPGFLHGFVSLADHTIFTYKVTAPYAPQCEFGVRYDDPKIAIQWPQEAEQFIISDKDLNLPFLADIESPF